MRQTLSAPDMNLYRAVDEVLHYVWDPIGVSGVPQARDEYRGYLPQVIGMLRNGADGATIAAYLTSVATERMGLSSCPDHDLAVASILLGLQECCRGDKP